MTPEDWARIKGKIDLLHELQGDDLEKLIAQVCEGSSELADELRSILAAHKAACGFLSVSPIVPENAMNLQPQFQPGELVAGRFRIARFIAQGGMGKVHEAEDLVLEE
jgi:hypothetical protein